jgi:hypothetical protein
MAALRTMSSDSDDSAVLVGRPAASSAAEDGAPLTLSSDHILADECVLLPRRCSNSFARSAAQNAAQLSSAAHWAATHTVGPHSTCMLRPYFIFDSAGGTNAQNLMVVCTGWLMSSCAQQLTRLGLCAAVWSGSHGPSSAAAAAAAQQMFTTTWIDSAASRYVDEQESLHLVQWLVKRTIMSVCLLPERPRWRGGTPAAVFCTKIATCIQLCA